MPRLSLLKVWREGPGGRMVSSVYHFAQSGEHPPRISQATVLADAEFGSLCSTRGLGLISLTVGTSSFARTSCGRAVANLITLCTANGAIPASEKEQIGFNIGPFAANTTALVLDETPSVLTVGAALCGRSIRVSLVSIPKPVYRPPRARSHRT